jgi:hypothetical protein
MEMKQKFHDNYDTIMATTEEERLAIFRAYMNDLVEDTAKWLKENNYFLG